MDVARRFIADINNHPHLKDGRNRGGLVQIIDLACIREALGAKWGTYADVIHRISVRTIEKHLDRAHSYTRRNDCYVLSFKGADPQTAGDRTRAIALALATYLFGTGKNDSEPMVGRARPAGKRPKSEGHGRLARLFGRVKSLFRFGRDATAKPRKDGKAKDGSVTPSAMAATANPEGGGAGVTETMHAGAPRGDPPRSPPSTSRDSGAPARLRDQGRAAPPAPPRQPEIAPPRAAVNGTAALAVVGPPSNALPATPALAPHPAVAAAPAPAIVADPAPPATPAPQPAIDPDEIDALENAMMAAAERLAREGERHALTPPIRGLHFFYRPMWSVRTNMMAISSCIPVARLPTGEMVTGAAVLPQSASTDFIQMLDHAALTHVLGDGQRLAEAQRSTLVSIPVHYETLVDKERRTAYLKMCQALPPGARRRILFECLGIHHGLGQSQLIAGIMALKPFCALIVGQLPLDAVNFTFWKTSGLSSVGVDIYDQITSPGGEAELIERLERFVFFTSQSGLRSYVRGLNTLSLAAAAVAAGFDFVEGGIIQDQIEPSDVRSFTLEDLYLQFAGARRAVRQQLVS